jgi:hypothetical protein
VQYVAASGTRKTPEARILRGGHELRWAVAIPPDVRADAEIALAAFCQQNSSEAVADQSRYEFEILENHALLVERRAGFLSHLEWTTVPVAKFRYSPAKLVWSLYWPDTNERWHRLSSAKAAKDIRTLLDAVKSDTSGVFWE